MVVEIVSINREHFDAGINHDLSLLGATGHVHAAGNQVSPLYIAEHAWQRNNAAAGQTISLGGARDLHEEVLFHPSMDSIPGIEDSRAAFKAGRIHQIPLLHRLTGMRAITNRAGSTLYDRTQPLRVGTVTHEAVHAALANATPEGAPIVGHGWGFARAHAYGAHHVLGGDAGEALANEYARQKVNFGKQFK